MISEAQEHYLVEKAHRGDKDAYGDLYEHYLDDVYRYVYFRIGNHQDAEDLTEAVFIKAWQSLARCYAEKALFRRWVFRIAGNAVIDHYRTVKQALSIDETMPVIDERMNLELNMDIQEEVSHLLTAVRQLSAVHQHVLVLRFANGLNTEETARVLDRSPGAVRVLQHRALKALQEVMLSAEGLTEGLIE